MTKRIPYNDYRTKVTPKLAKEWLERNTHNRKLRPGFVEQLAKAMLFGEWVFNGDAIRFDWNGNILDGQHRLHAVLVSGVTIDAKVIEGLDPRSQDTMDRGKPRSMADILHLRGESNAIQLAATATTLWKLNTGKMLSNTNSDNRPTPGQVLALLDEHGDKLRSAVRHGGQLGAKIPLSSTIISCCWFRFSELDEDDCRDFWAAVTTGFHLNGDAAMPDTGPYQLTRYAHKNRMSTKRAPQHVLHALTIKAWNAYREGRKVGLLVWKSGGMNAEAFPEPV